MTALPKFSATGQPTVRQPSHGLCPVCGFLAQLDVLGQVGWHRQIAIKGFRPDGTPNEYKTDVQCDGEGDQPEPITRGESQ